MGWTNTSRYENGQMMIKKLIKMGNLKGVFEWYKNGNKKSEGFPKMV